MLIMAAAALLLASRPEPAIITILPPPPTATLMPTYTPTTTATPLPIATPAPTTTPSPLKVYVSGAVATPQLVTLPVGSRIADAVAAAGGATSDADLTRINMAEFLRDATQIHLPALEEEGIALPTPILATPILPTPTIVSPTIASASSASSSGAEKVRINSASQTELESLPGIGPVTAARIIAYREQNGNFVELDDLDAVSGIGPAKLENLRGRVAFD